ncbi:MAG: PAS domain-containing protein, partial [Burkholderiaceae bacterium]|nr:PAS domain-containing protein [Burkholderiaceae bacterium]
MTSLLVLLLLALLAIFTAVLVAGHWRARRFLRWIANPSATPAPDLAGAWGLAVAYARRALTRGQVHANESAARLDALLAALDALPAGRMLLDGDGRICFCTAAAAAHFGLDRARDLTQHVVHLVRDPAFVAW